MKRVFLLAAILCCSFLAKAQKVDTTIYYGCRIKNDTTTYVGLQTNNNTKIPDCTIDSWPKFLGGDKAFYRFLAKNLKWPKTNEDIQGKVIVSFIVEKNGTLTHIIIVRSLGILFDKEALRVIKLFPHWKPAKINGKPVRSKFYIPIQFNMDN